MTSAGLGHELSFRSWTDVALVFGTYALRVWSAELLAGFLRRLAR